VQLLLGLIAEGAKDTAGGFMGTSIALRPAVAHVTASRAVQRGGSRPTSEVPFSVGAKRTFEEAVKESQRLSHQYISAEHILLALLTVDDGACDVISALGEDQETLRSAALKRLQAENSAESGEGGAQGAAAGARMTSARAGGRKKGKNDEGDSVLEEYGTDLTALARKGKIDPVIGRNEEVARCVEILARRRKNNPILLGEPGVGKTAIAEALALRIVSGKCADFLLGKRVVALDTGLLMAGAKERGELESRVTKLLEEVVGDDDIILMIDEYTKYVEKDAALARRFQPVVVPEPSKDEALEILRGLRQRYEEHHKVAFDDDALQAAVELSARYIPDRFLPDKAIDLMDEAGSRARIEAFKSRKKERAEAATETDLTDSSAMWHQLNAVRARREAAADKADSGETAVVAEVGAAEIEAVASAWTKIPLQQLTEDDNVRLLSLEDELRGRVIGQDEAVHAVSRSLRRGRTGLASPDRPQGVFLFSGPTGVGKTELCKALCGHMFGDDGRMVRLDMSEYMERHTVAKLIGAPPGYAGYGDGGTLTEAIRRNPYTVVLLDEVEKAHPDVFNILLQVFEDGRLTDSTGRVVDFKNTLLIMTSNVGAQVITKGGSGGIGFEVMDDSQPDGGRHARMRSMVLDELKSYFKPELLNRLDEVVVFRRLTRENVRTVATYMLHDLGKRLADKGVMVRVTEAAMDVLLERGYDEAMGARPMRRAITQLVEDSMCEALLMGEFEVGDTAVVDAEGGEMRITVTGDLCDPTEHQCYTSEEDVQLIEQMKVGQVDSITA
jgi:ATP-dependent Clp protease ATP-binding subunit ClpC